MAEINVTPIKEGGVELKTNGTTVIITGCINHPKPEIFMEPFIDKVHNNIIDKKIKNIEVDITDLRFLNSAGIRELVDWIMRLNSLSEGEKYKIKFICSSEHKWQESSISTLIYLNPDYASKETA